MYHEMAEAWSVLMLRGICNVLFALVAFLQPDLTLMAMVLMWGVYAVVDGATSLTTGIAARRGGNHYWSLMLVGVCGLVAGIIACVWPGLTLRLFVAILAAWALIRGAFETIAATMLRHALPRSWLLAMSGAASMAFGALLLIEPTIGLLTLVYQAGGSAFVFGILAIMLAFHLRRFSSESHGGTPSRLPA
jgi:uncharacterized membrane protein HdeD (DUF308 family)